MKSLHKGDVIEAVGDRRYVVQRKLGEGQFAEVWEVRLSDGSRHDARYALKLEKRKDRSTVKQEYKALKKLAGTCDQVVSVECFGVFDERFYMVLQLLGETLFDARKAAGGRLDVSTVRAVGLSTLGAIQQVHGASLIHRDIKPANFVINPPNSAAGKGTWLLIDFGLARRFTDDAGGHLTPRSDASFRGSTTYASVHAHRDEDLSRRDDLWSWLYMLTELLDGGLPWRVDKEEHSHMVDKQWVQQQKEAAMEQPSLLTRTVPLPEPLEAICSHLKGLSFEAAPDYALLRSCLQRLPEQQLPLRDLTGPPPQQQQQQQQLNGQPAPWQLPGQQLADLWQAQQPQQQAEQADAAGQEQDLARQQQQQQQTLLMTPASPPQEHQQPAAAAPPPPPPSTAQQGAAAAAAADTAAGNKRPRPAAAPAGASDNKEQAAKKLRPDSSSATKPSTSGHQQQQQKQAGSSVRAPGAASAGDDSKPGSRPGSANAAAAPAPAGSGRLAASSERGGARQQQQQQQHRRSDSRSSSRERQAAARGRPGRPDSGSHGDNRPRQPQRSGSTGTREPAAAAQSADKAAANARQGQQQQQQQRPVGRQGEIADLLAAFSSDAPDASREAANKAVQGLCSLPPVAAVCAIGMTLDRLVAQSDPACRPAVSQLLADLAAYASAGAAKARQQQQGQQQQRQQGQQQQGQQGS